MWRGYREGEASCMTSDLLKLKARDNEDVEVLSAILQDAIVPVCDIAYEPQNKLLIMAPQRLCWEDPQSKSLSRICCAVHIHGVESAETMGLDLNEGSRMLDLLALLFEDGALTFIFAGNAKIRLQLNAWWIALEDFGDAWPTACQPSHEEKITG